MTGVKLFFFSVAAGGLPIAQSMLPSEALGAARTLEQSSPTYVLAVVAIVFAIALVKQSKRIEKLTDDLLGAIKENTEASAALKAVVDECHQRNR